MFIHDYVINLDLCYAFILFIKELQYVDLFILSICFSSRLYLLSLVVNVRIYIGLLLIFSLCSLIYA
jgi:hypothetical protein